MFYQDNLFNELIIDNFAGGGGASVGIELATEESASKRKTVFDIMAENDSKRKMADFMVKQKQPYEFKKRYAVIRAKEFVKMCEDREKNYHVSVGGLDSIVLLLFLRSIGINCPAISVSSLEDKSIQRVHKALGITALKSAKRPDGTYWKKPQIIQEFGFPVLSKELAAKIEILQNASEKNATVRHAIITGETGEYGGNRKNTRMKMPQRCLELFGGYENENEGVNYRIAPFKVSSKCCYYLKEKPCDDWAKEHNSVPFLGLMASEGGRREKSLKMHGCNYWGKSTVRSAPFAIFSRQDLLQMAIDMEKWYQNHWREFNPIYIDSKTGKVSFCEPIHLDTIVPEIYGKIERDSNGTLRTTLAQRTGCSMCGFGIHIEDRPHRFDQLRQRNYKEWDYYMNHLCKDENGDEYGWGLVLDYIGVGWRDEVVKIENYTVFDEVK